MENANLARRIIRRENFPSLALRNGSFPREIFNWVSVRACKESSQLDEAIKRKL